MAKSAAGTQSPTVHRATLGSQGRVVRGEQISKDEAIAERRTGDNIVVCGGPLRANRNLAREIESAVGPCKRQDPHKSAGPYALPHFQQESPPPEGHSFYETDNRKAARNP
jgi:hypothetical protein